MDKQSSLEDVKGADVYPEPQIEVVDADPEYTGPIVGTHRGLKLRHIQLIGIGSTIGTGLFLGCGRSLISAGPLGSLLAYMAYCCICFGICLGAGEMGAFKPVAGGFITWAHDYVDEAAGFAVGWNYFYAATMFGCADIVGVAGLFGYWWPDITPAAWISMSIGVIFILNVFSVKFYGESEFYFAGMKVLLILAIILMTFVVMLGGNPAHDRIGFRYWKEPGPWASYYTTGPLGRFLGFWNVFKIAAYSVGGPEFVSMCAGEAVRPRKTIPKAVKGVLFRLTVFFFLGILACGILVPYDDEYLKQQLATGVGANASAYVVGMKRVGIKYMPDIFNAIVITSALSCANGFAFVASRVVHSLALKRQAPAFFARTTKHGVPAYALILVLAVYCLCYMQVSNNAATVFGWLINLSSVAQLLNYVAMAITTLRFRAGLKAQGMSRNVLPWSTKYTVTYTWICLFWLVIIVLTQGWVVFVHGGWDVQTFLTCYFGLAFVVVTYFGWKLWHKTSIVRTSEMDFTSFVPEYDLLDEQFREMEQPPKTALGRWLKRYF
ncbi:hypothetical protein IAR55_001663 [Kwoniella newhampshirensis]|uniref:Amino acid permease/ SLC12A domain-containing protein n=1 Tax=Kwoniella newhampshirensis TaxID=1651941 RepID=A0AAW0Z2T5_9TREE